MKSVKIDFVISDSQSVLKLYENILKERSRNRNDK